MIQRRGQPTTDRIGNSLIRDLPSRRCTDWFIEPARPTTSKKTVINIGRRARFRSTPRSEDKAGGIAGDPRIADGGAPYREHRGLNRHIREMALRTGVEVHACIGAARCGRRPNLCRADGREFSMIGHRDMVFFSAVIGSLALRAQPKVMPEAASSAALRFTPLHHWSPPSAGLKPAVSRAKSSRRIPLGGGEFGRLPAIAADPG
jgi:hypothetical protein